MKNADMPPQMELVYSLKKEDYVCAVKMLLQCGKFRILHWAKLIFRCLAPFVLVWVISWIWEGFSATPVWISLGVGWPVIILSYTTYAPKDIAAGLRGDAVYRYSGGVSRRRTLYEEYKIAKGDYSEPPQELNFNYKRYPIGKVKLWLMEDGIQEISTRGRDRYIRKEIFFPFRKLRGILVCTEYTYLLYRKYHILIWNGAFQTEEGYARFWKYLADCIHKPKPVYLCSKLPQLSEGYYKETIRMHPGKPIAPEWDGRVMEQMDRLFGQPVSG